MVIGKPSLAGQFNYYTDGSRSNPVSYIYAKDIDRDGVDEVFFVSFETQPNTAQNYSNTSVHIFGWKNNSFQEITNQWLPNNTNLVEGVGDVAFGDFNGDGLIDVFLSAYTDMNFAVNAYQLINKGTKFEKISLGLETWMHGVAAADVNRDSFDDVIVAGYSSFHQYLGSSQGLIKYSGMVGSSGLTLGDFLGNGTITAIFVDAGSSLNDTFLYRFDFNDGSKSIGLTKVASLPGPRLAHLGLEKNGSSSHDIRARAIDFNGDGLLDVLVFSYLANYSGGLGQNDHKSEIQFLLNRGNGNFSDATDQYRINYDVTGYVGYYPQISDFNLDGLPDIFSSVSDWFPSHNSTTLLVQQQNGTFLDTDRSLLSQNFGQMSASQAIIASGPNNEKFLISEGKWDWSNPVTKVYIQSLLFPERNYSEILIGNNLNNTIYGLGGNDSVRGLAGDDSIDGGTGIDTAQYQGSAAGYAVTIGSTTDTVVDRTSNRDGTDTLIDVERLKFSDTNVALDIGRYENAGQAYRLYKAAFNRLPDQEGLGFWIYAFDNGSQLNDVAQGFINSDEFPTFYGFNSPNAVFLSKLYNNVLGRNYDQEGYNFWLAALNNGLPRNSILAQFSESPENISNVIDLIGQGIPYKEWLG